MKRILAVLFCFLVIFSCSISVFAAENENIIFRDTYVENNGITVIDEVIEHPQMRSTNKTYTHKKTFLQDNVVIGIIAITGTFSFDGNTVSVVSKSVSQTDTYEGWSYKQTSFTSSGGTITLNGKLTKLIVIGNPFTITLSCDKNGNISYT